MTTVAYISKIPFSKQVTEKIENYGSLKLIDCIEYKRDAILTIQQMKPEIVIMDMEEMQIETIIKMIQCIKSTVPDVKLITSANNLQSVYYFQIIEAGIDSIIEKRSDFANNLIRTIIYAQNNYFVIPTALTAEFVERLDELRHDNFDFFNKRLNEYSSNLSVKEVEVAYYLRQNMRNGEIAEKLNITEGTAKVHISKIYKKINIKGRKNMVEYLDRIMSNGRESVEV
ncbi:response regulator transcription factor [Oceanobacillus damuensis]|uniref:response regulator transcription factor n=1 Tax=Oceanobacillus damuensis TaxID=937928 RepID=UPI00082F7A50|nr:response regulator transcription factor [Oceanobacillus damuensis]